MKNGYRGMGDTLLWEKILEKMRYGIQRVEEEPASRKNISFSSLVMRQGTV